MNMDLKSDELRGKTEYIYYIDEVFEFKNCSYLDSYIKKIFGIESPNSSNSFIYTNKDLWDLQNLE